MTDKTFATDRHGWAELLPPRQATAALTGTHRIPWAVIGAGLTGLAAARRLALQNPNDEIYLLDAREVGQGASGRNSGFAVAVSHFPGPFDAEEIPTYQRINRINSAGLDILRDQVQDHAIDCQWREDGFYHAAADSPAIREAEYFQDYLARMDVPHTVLDRHDIADRLGTNHYTAGAHVHDGALLQPAALVRGLADSLPGNVRLFENNPVLKIYRDVPIRLVCASGEIQSDKVIVATNYEAGKIGYLRNTISASTLAGSFTRKLTDDEFASLGSVPEWGILSLHGGGATVRLTADRRLSIRNTAEYHKAALLTDAELTVRQKIHRAGFDLRFPQLAHVPFEFAWSGVEGVSRNGTNFFGQQANNIYLAGGFNGSGVSRGTAFGTAIADYAMGGSSDLISYCLVSPKAAWIPPSPLKDLGAWWTVRRRFRDVGFDR
jgi:glycine/D-amino acid oxidase-like deaminating enzyme